MNRILSLTTLPAILMLVAVVTAEPAYCEARPEASAETGEAHWGYAGDVAPEHWGSLSPDFALCDEGRMQSPVDLTGAVPAETIRLRRAHGDEVLSLQQRAEIMDLIDNGHTIQVTTDAKLALDYDGETYEMVQLHFHSPSEHTIDGRYSPLEVHFVHQSASGELVVVGVLVDEGEADPVFDRLFQALPASPDDPRHLEGLDFDMSKLRPLPQRYYRYEGSLTTPPCSEGVHWLVMAETRQMSPRQMHRLISHLYDNNRPIQPLGDRRIELVSRDD